MSSNLRCDPYQTDDVAPASCRTSMVQRNSMGCARTMWATALALAWLARVV
jgi:hypothetical protein